MVFKITDPNGKEVFSVESNNPIKSEEALPISGKEIAAVSVAAIVLVSSIGGAIIGKIKSSKNKKLRDKVEKDIESLKNGSQPEKLKAAKEFSNKFDSTVDFISKCADMYYKAISDAATHASTNDKSVISKLLSNKRGKEYIKSRLTDAIVDKLNGGRSKQVYIELFNWEVTDDLYDATYKIEDYIWHNLDKIKDVDKKRNIEIMFGNGDDYGLYVDISDLLKSVSE
jgi:hypothetical protein